MILLFGILLTPVGALIGSVLVLVVMSLLPSERLRGDELLGVAQLDFMVGILFAAPVTIVLLPLTYELLRRTGSLSLARLTLAGAGFGFASVWAVALWFLVPKLFWSALEPLTPSFCSRWTAH